MMILFENRFITSIFGLRRHFNIDWLFLLCNPLWSSWLVKPQVSRE
jgi:hypothetical protein